MSENVDPNLPSMPGMDYINPGDDFNAFDPGFDGIIPPSTDILKSQMDGIIKKMGSFEKTLSSLKRYVEETSSSVNEIRSETEMAKIQSVTQNNLSEFSNKLDLKMNSKNSAFAEEIENLQEEVKKLKSQNVNLHDLLRQKTKTAIKLVDPDIEAIKNVQKYVLMFTGIGNKLLLIIY